MASIVVPFFLIILLILGVFSYGFIDPNLILSTHPVFLKFQEPLKNLAYHQRPIAAVLFFAILIGLFACFCVFLKHGVRVFESWKKLCMVLVASAVILACSYPGTYI